MILLSFIFLVLFVLFYYISYVLTVYLMKKASNTCKYDLNDIQLASVPFVNLLISLWLLTVIFSTRREV